MDFIFSPELEAFRREIRQFIQEHLPADWDERDDTDEDGAVSRVFQKALAERQWLTVAWPREYGGLAASHWQQFIMNEEMGYRGAPSSNSGVAWVGPALMLHGSEAQKQEHLNAIATAQTWWCTMYSEPSAGSDLAGLQTRAVEDGDDYVINGQKVWTGWAHQADWGWLATRTDPDAPKHKGISLFLLDMRSPGVTVRPLVNMANVHNFNEVFLDNVRIPKRNLVGEVNRGWYYMAAALDFERSAIGSYARTRRHIDDLTAFARAQPQHVRRNPHIRHELADRAIEVQVGTYLGCRVVHLQDQGIVPNYEAAVSQTFSTALQQRVARTGVALLGLYGGLWGQDDADDPLAPLRGRMARLYASSVGSTIATGTREIQQNVIATRGLGLPRA